MARGFFSFFKRKKQNEDEIKQQEVQAEPISDKQPEDSTKSAAESVSEIKAKPVVETDVSESAVKPELKEKESVEVNSVHTQEAEQISIQAEPEHKAEAEEKSEAVPEVKPDTEADTKADQAENEPLNPESSASQTQNEHQSADSEQPAAETKERLSFFARLKRTRENLAFGLESLIKGRQIDDDLYDEIETSLLTADLGVETASAVIEKLREESKLRELRDASALRRNLKRILCDILKPCEIELKPDSSKGPFVILMVGVNGAGKTTTIGKLADKFMAQGLKVMLAAGDTFRAAAVEQLQAWGQRAGVPVIAQPTGSDSASVLYDALSSAKARKVDVLLCDTAGRLQNKENLMEELRKIVRVMRKLDPNVPQEVLLVLDAATGQNAVSQAKLFSQAVTVTGLCLTKLDGTAKGGVVFALANQFKVPIRYVGIGEKAEDLRVFKADTFVDALVENEK